jgi:hypothetical protein
VFQQEIIILSMDANVLKKEKFTDVCLKYIFFLNTSEDQLVLLNNIMSISLLNNIIQFYLACVAARDNY